MQNISKLFTAFVKDEDGVALTEYLILLGLVCAAVIIAVTAFGTNIGTTFQEWANFIVDPANGLGAP